MENTPTIHEIGHPPLHNTQPNKTAGFDRTVQSAGSTRIPDLNSTSNVRTLHVVYITERSRVLGALGLRIGRERSRSLQSSETGRRLRRCGSRGSSSPSRAPSSTPAPDRRRAPPLQKAPPPWPPIERSCARAPRRSSMARPCGAGEPVARAKDKASQPC